MSVRRLVHLAPVLAILAALFAPAGWAQWLDGRYQYRVPFTVINSTSQAFAAGDVMAATVPYQPMAGRIRQDGTDAILFHNGSPIPCKVLVMGGSVKVLLPLQSDLPAGDVSPQSQSGYVLYFGALETVPLPAQPAGIQAWDFLDGELHGWKSLQDPGSTGMSGSDVRVVQDGAWGGALLLNTTKYHHPVAFADTMTPVAESTVYTRVRTGGGENEVGAFQRFNTQTLYDNYEKEYLTGADIPGVGLALDSYGAQRMGIVTSLGNPEGDEGRRHPGPNTLEPGSVYNASPDNDQYIITSTQDATGATILKADGWQSNPSDLNPAGDPTPGDYQISRNTAYRTGVAVLPAGKVGLMIYSTSVFLRWMVVVPNPYAEMLTTEAGPVEESTGPGAGRAIVRGMVYEESGGFSAPLAGAAVRITDAGGTELAVTETNASGLYQSIVSAGPTALAVTITATGPGYSGTASQSIVEDTIYDVNVRIQYEGSLTGRVTLPNGTPVAGAAVGRFLDGRGYVFTDIEGRYTLPVPHGILPIGAHTSDAAMAGPRWIDTSVENPTADFVLFPSGPNIILGKTPTVTPTAGTNAPAITDGNAATFWESGDVSTISDANPLRITFPMNDATVTGIDVHWKDFPAAWRVEMTLDVTYSNGSNPHPDTRTYYAAGGNGPVESGGYLAPGTTDRHVVAVKTAPVVGVKSLTIVVTDPGDADALALYEIVARTKQPTTMADAGAAMRIMAGLQSAPQDLHAFWRWNAWNGDNRIDWKDAVELIRDTTREVHPLRVLVINYEPIIESMGNRKVRQIFGWPDPHVNTEGHRKDMERASRNYLRINLHPQFDMDEYPLFLDGTRYNDTDYVADTYAGSWNRGGGDYNAIIKQFDLARRVSTGDVDEVWLQGIPGFGWWETTLAGPNGYWCNSGPVSGDNGTRLFCLTGFNYERGNDVMLEDWGHRSESILGGKVYGGWNTVSERTTFDRFTRFEKITPGRASCGNVHYPPNGVADYDFANTAYVSTDADDWFNYPNLTGARTTINRNAWKGPHMSGGVSDFHRNYHIWWFERMPRVPGLGPDGKQANWWKYIVDFNSHPESR